MRRAFVSVAAIAAGIAGAPASANTVDINYQGVVLGAQVSIGGVVTGTFNAGVMRSTFSNGPLGFPSGQVHHFCTELLQGTPSSTTTYDIVEVEQAPDPGDNVDGPPPGDMGVIRAGHMRKVVGWAVDRGLFNGVVNSNVINGNTYTNNQIALATQILVWEIVYDDGQAGMVAADLNVMNGEGNFYLTSNGTNFTNLIRDIWTEAMTYAEFDSVATVNVEFQDFLIPIPLPTPAGLASIGMLGALGLASSRRRR